MITTLLFDLDGTLLDTERGILASFRHTLAMLGSPPRSDAELRKHIGPPLKESWTELVGEEYVDRATEVYRQRYSQKGKFEACVFPGIEESLQTLSRNYTLIVATSKRKNFALEMLAHFELAVYFQGIYGNEPSNFSESKASLIGRILQDFALIPSQTVMVGDRQYDMIGARANHLKAIGALWGYGSREELQFHGANALCQTPSDLAETVAKLS